MVNIKKYFTALIFTIFASHNLLANEIEETATSNNSAIDSAIYEEIEKSLLFDNDELSNISSLSDKTDNKNSREPINKNLNIKSKKSKNKIDIDLKAKERMAYNQYLSGQYEAAIELYKQIIEIDNSNQYAKFSIAVIYQKLGQNKEAIVIYKELLSDKKITNKQEIISNLFLAMSKEKPKETIFILNKLSKQNPNSDYLQAQLAMIYSQENNYNQAILYMEKAREINSSEINYSYNLAIFYDKNKNFKKALELYMLTLKNYDKDLHKNNKIDLTKIQNRIDILRKNYDKRHFSLCRQK